MAVAGGRFSVISAAEVQPIRVGSAQDRGGLPQNKFSPPSPRRIPRRKFLFRQKNNLSDSASEAIGTTRTYSDSGGLNWSLPRNCSAPQITIKGTSALVVKSKFFRLVKGCYGNSQSLAARNSLFRSPRSSIPDQRWNSSTTPIL